MITGSPSLRVLDVSWNNIRDDGISLFLQHINTLTELRVTMCGLSVEGSYCLYILLLASYIANQLATIVIIIIKLPIIQTQRLLKNILHHFYHSICKS